MPIDEEVYIRMKRDSLMENQLKKHRILEGKVAKKLTMRKE